MNNTTYEKMLISSLMDDPSSISEYDIDRDLFTQLDYCELFTAIDTLYNSGREVNILSVHNHLKDLDPKYTISMLTELETGTYYDAKILVDDLLLQQNKRRLFGINPIISKLSQPGVELSEITDGISKIIATLEDGKTEVSTAADAMREAFGEFESWYQSKGQIVGLPCGLDPVDEHFKGFDNPDCVLIAARPSIGKTAFALDMAVNMVSAGVKVLFFSLEMSRKKLGHRIYQHQGLDVDKFRLGVATPSDFAKSDEIYSRFHDGNLLINDQGRVTIQTIKSDARKAAKQGVRAIFIDYIGLIKHGDYRMPKHERVSEIMGELFGLSKELNLPIFILSQINREGEGKRPDLSMLRDSGSLEQDADKVIFLHRPQRDNPETEIIIAKWRGGSTGSISMYFDMKYQRFRKREKTSEY